MKHALVWERRDVPGMEYAELEVDPTRILGEVVVVDQGVPCALSYELECDHDGATSRAVLRFRRQGTLTVRTILRDRAGRWTVDGTPAPALDGLLDIDLSLTPSTNTLPLRRLRLAVGQEAEVVAAWVKFPSLEVVPLRQRYRRLAATAYEYRALDHRFTAALDCDEDGVVTRYGEIWIRRG